MKKKQNRFSRIYVLLNLIALKNLKNNYSLLGVLLIKAKLKKEFGIKSLKDLDDKKLKEFEKFLLDKLS